MKSNTKYLQSSLGWTSKLEKSISSSKLKPAMKRKSYVMNTENIEIDDSVSIFKALDNVKKRLKGGK
jgi:hypothetical protein